MVLPNKAFLTIHFLKKILRKNYYFLCALKESQLIKNCISSKNINDDIQKVLHSKFKHRIGQWSCNHHLCAMMIQVRFLSASPLLIILRSNRSLFFSNWVTWGTGQERKKINSSSNLVEKKQRLSQRVQSYPSYHKEIKGRLTSIQKCLRLTIVWKMKSLNQQTPHYDEDN